MKDDKPVTNKRVGEVANPSQLPTIMGKNALHCPHCKAEKGKEKCIETHWICRVLLAHEQHYKSLGEKIGETMNKTKDANDYEKLYQEMHVIFGSLKAIHALKSQSPLYDTSLYSKKDKPAEITVEKGTPQVSKSRKGEVKK